MFGQKIYILSLLFHLVQGYLPTSDLTNSIILPYENLIEKETDEGDSSEIDEPSASPYRNRLTFRRRNMNSGGMNMGGSNSPFSRMNYRGGYGSNRQRPFNSHSPYTNSNGYNGYGGGSSSPLSSGLIGNRERNFGFFGSTAAMRNKNNYKSRFPNYYGNRQTNDLMGSFNTEGMGGNINMISNKFGGPNTYIPQIPDRESQNQYFNPYYPDYSPYRGEYGGRILSNRWNDKSNIGEIESAVDGYAAASAKQKTQKTQKAKALA